MSIVIDCPTCGRKLRVVEDLIGRAVKCPGCATNFSAAGPAPAPPPFSPTPPAETVQSPPETERQPAPPPVPEYGQPSPSMDDRPYRTSRRDCDPHRGGLVLTFGILSLLVPLLGLVLGILAIMFGNRDMARMREGSMDPEGQGLTQAGFICGIIGSVLQGINALCCVGYLAMIAAIASSVPKAPPPNIPIRSMQVDVRPAQFLHTPIALR